jgi:hypothetical protein
VLQQVREGVGRPGVEGKGRAGLIESELRLERDEHAVIAATVVQRPPVLLARVVEDDVVSARDERRPSGVADDDARSWEDDVGGLADEIEGVPEGARRRTVELADCEERRLEQELRTRGHVSYDVRRRLRSDSVSR